MSVSESVLKENKIKFVCIGNLYETALEVKDNVEVQVGKKEEGKTVKCKQITGKVSVDTGSGVVTLFPQFNEIGYDGKENVRWTMAKSMLDWNPKIKGDSSKPVTRVMLEGILNYYDGYVRDSNKPELKKSYRIERATTSVPDTIEDGFSFEGYFFIAGTNVNDETGVGSIRAYYSNYRGEVIPVDCIVDSEDVDIVFEGDGDDFEAIEPGQTRQLKISYYRTTETNTEVEETKTKKFGGNRKTAPDIPTHNRFKEEYVLTSASECPVEEPEQEYDDDGNAIDTNSVWYNPVAVKKAIKARAQKLEEMENNPPEKKSGGSAKKPGNASLQAKKQAAKDKMKGGMKAQASFDAFDDKEDPF